MRCAARPTLLALALVAGLVLPGIVDTAVTGAASAHSPAPVQAAASKHAPAPGRAGAKAHRWSLRLEPAPDDFALVQIRFPGMGHRAIARDLLNIEMQAPFGS